MSLKIATWNIACLPTLINPLRTPTFAVPNIINMLDKVEADIFCLQEVFCIKTRHSLVDRFISRGYNVQYDRKDNIISKNGLLTVSKFPIINKTDMDYANFIGPEYLIKKGMISCEIEIDKKNLIVHNTHLQSNSMGPIVDSCAKIRRKQHRDINEYLISDCFLNYKEEPLHFLCGDINDDYESEGLIDFVNNLPFRNTSINKQKMITFKGNEKQLDYIICSKNLEIDYSVLDIDRKLSDHNILIAELEI